MGNLFHGKEIRADLQLSPSEVNCCSNSATGDSIRFRVGYYNIDEEKISINRHAAVYLVAQICDKTGHRVFYPPFRRQLFLHAALQLSLHCLNITGRLVDLHSRFVETRLWASSSSHSVQAKADKFLPDLYRVQLQKRKEGGSKLGSELTCLSPTGVYRSIRFLALLA